MNKQEIDFRDADALAAQVDQWSDYGALFEVDQALINQFAELSGDYNWIHVDVERARRESPFGGTVAHGNLLLALLSRIPPREHWIVVGHRQAVNRGFNRIRFVQPVLAGQQLRGRSRLTACEVRPAGSDLVKEYCLFRAGEDTPVLVAEIVLRYA